MGHDAGGGILGMPLPRNIQGTPIGFALPVHPSEEIAPYNPPFPKIEFPKFDGTNPRLWWDNCERYFEVYVVQEALKTRFATLNFKGAAVTWLQTVERHGRIGDWNKLCELVMAKYDKDQY